MKRTDQIKIGVIGTGFVGSAVANGFSSEEVKVYDKNPNSSTHSLRDVILQDFVFICVPTPMRDVMGDDCNLSIIESCFSEIKKINGCDTSYYGRNCHYITHSAVVGL